MSGSFRNKIRKCCGKSISIAFTSKRSMCLRTHMKDFQRSTDYFICGGLLILFRVRLHPDYTRKFVKIQHVMIVEVKE